MFGRYDQERAEWFARHYTAAGACWLYRCIVVGLFVECHKYAFIPLISHLHMPKCCRAAPHICRCADWQDAAGGEGA